MGRRKKLIRVGSSYAIIIDKPLLAALRMSPESELRITIQNEALVIERVLTELSDEPLKTTSPTMPPKDDS